PHDSWRGWRQLMRSLVVGRVFVLAFAVCALALAPPPASAGRAAHAAELGSGATLKRIAVIDLPGPPGRRFDYLAIDDDDRYLFSAHLAAGLLYVIDLRTSTVRSEEHTSELQSRFDLVCRLLLEKKKYPKVQI